MGAESDGFNVPTKLLAPWNMHAELYALSVRRILKDLARGRN